MLRWLVVLSLLFGLALFTGQSGRAGEPIIDDPFPSPPVVPKNPRYRADLVQYVPVDPKTPIPIIQATVIRLPVPKPQLAGLTTQKSRFIYDNVRDGFIARDSEGLEGTPNLVYGRQDKLVGVLPMDCPEFFAWFSSGNRYALIKLYHDGVDLAIWDCWAGRLVSRRSFGERDDFRITKVFSLPGERFRVLARDGWAESNSYDIDASSGLYTKLNIPHWVVTAPWFSPSAAIICAYQKDSTQTEAQLFNFETGMESTVDNLRLEEYISGLSDDGTLVMTRENSRVSIISSDRNNKLPKDFDSLSGYKMFVSGNRMLLVTDDREILLWDFKAGRYCGKLESKIMQETLGNNYLAHAFINNAMDVVVFVFIKSKEDYLRETGFFVLLKM
ncbi:MAG: hypothetical protein SFX18_09665 [Pirellulales bacterium]|nr:hypothetical protein [Pirellulales bacterium]